MNVVYVLSKLNRSKVIEHDGRKATLHGMSSLSTNHLKTNKKIIRDCAEYIVMRDDMGCTVPVSCVDKDLFSGWMESVGKHQCYVKNGILKVFNLHPAQREVTADISNSTDRGKRAGMTDRDINDFMSGRVPSKYL